jgi:hypothetical protein
MVKNKHWSLKNERQAAILVARKFERPQAQFRTELNQQN